MLNARYLWGQQPRYWPLEDSDCRLGGVESSMVDKTLEKLKPPFLSMLGTVALAIASAAVGGYWGYWQGRKLTAPKPVEMAISPPTAPVQTRVDAEFFLLEALERAQYAGQLGGRAKTEQEWDSVASLWQEAITLMKKIPQYSNKYDLAQEKIAAYQQQLQTAREAKRRSGAFRQAVNNAMQAAKLGQTAKTESEWNLTASLWEKASELMKVVPSSSPKYRLAQQKVSEYEKNLNYAKQQVAKRSQPVAYTENALSFASTYIPSPVKQKAPERGQIYLQDLFAPVSIGFLAEETEEPEIVKPGIYLIRYQVAYQKYKTERTAIIAVFFDQDANAIDHQIVPK